MVCIYVRLLVCCAVLKIGFSFVPNQDDDMNENSDQKIYSLSLFPLCSVHIDFLSGREYTHRTDRVPAYLSSQRELSSSSQLLLSSIYSPSSYSSCRKGQIKGLL